MRKREYECARPGWPEISWGDKSARFARKVPRKRAANPLRARWASKPRRNGGKWGCFGIKNGVAACSGYLGMQMKIIYSGNLLRERQFISHAFSVLSISRVRGISAFEEIRFEKIIHARRRDTRYNKLVTIDGCFECLLWDNHFM